MADMIDEAVAYLLTAMALMMAFLYGGELLMILLSITALIFSFLILFVVGRYAEEKGS